MPAPSACSHRDRLGFLLFCLHHLQTCCLVLTCCCDAGAAGLQTACRNRLDATVTCCSVLFLHIRAVNTSGTGRYGLPPPPVIATGFHLPGTSKIFCLPLPPACTTTCCHHAITVLLYQGLLATFCSLLFCHACCLLHLPAARMVSSLFGFRISVYRPFAVLP